ncbi:hypothetical protein GCM10018785_34380 [Streptomyces longispororuber]|uniref:Uncharacterized protein n=1 Tax=Streptomyces longispororuber TaxID=68230 RepID=A0A919DP64_9ACTN|nr:hypothetical protein GCM10018785_34380 [Streptomyces longispororuber]
MLLSGTARAGARWAAYRTDVTPFLRGGSGPGDKPRQRRVLELALHPRRLRSAARRRRVVPGADAPDPALAEPVVRGAEARPRRRGRPGRRGYGGGLAFGGLGLALLVAARSYAARTRPRCAAARR